MPNKPRKPARPRKPTGSRQSKDLTGNQILILDHLRNWTKPYSPSYQDLMVDLGMSSTSIVHYTIKTLKQRGLVDMTPGVARSIVLTETGRNTPLPTRHAA